MQSPIYSTKGPLDPVRDERVLVERRELWQIVRLATQASVGSYVAVLSPRQTGKTTLLYHAKGVLAGLDWAAGQGAAHIVTVAADTPFFPADLVEQLEIAAQSAPIALAATPDPDRGLLRHPTFGLWPVALRDDLRESLRAGTRKIVAWTDRHGTALAEFPVTPFDPFFNLNRPEDMVQAETILRARD